MKISKETMQKRLTLCNAIYQSIIRAPHEAKGYFDFIGAAKTAEYADVRFLIRKVRTLAVTAMRDGADVADFYEVYGQLLLLEAPNDFESFMEYIELDRAPHEKFYHPRKKQLKEIVEAMQALEDDELDELFLSMPARTGKALADDTPILTTKGWKNHGDLVVGDELFRPDGTTTRVIAVHPKCDMTHTVTFTDGSKINCHFRHEWKVYDRRFGKTRLLETQEMIDHVEDPSPTEGWHRHNFMIANKQFLQGIEKDLPVPPYTLGAWLGDGSNCQPRITGDKEDYAVIERIEKDGFPVRNRYMNSKTGVPSYDFDGLRDALHELNLCYAHHRVPKHIPAEYLTASIDQRLELLAGLLDTDGCLRRSEHRYTFTTSEETLRDSFISLIATFGWRVCIVEYEPRVSTSGVVGKHKCWVIGFNPTIPIPCVLERKRLNEFSKQRRLAIEAIEPIAEPKQGNCISVEGDGMYLAGERLIPTHNTTITLFYVCWLIGRHPENSNLYCTYSDSVAKVFYQGILEVITDPYTYHWQKVFPHCPLVSKNAADLTVNILRKNRYRSITCRSIDGTLNGACDCAGLMIGDDLCSGYEEAISKDRMLKLWGKVDNNLIPRAKQTAKHLWIGTRWSVVDPEGMRIGLLENDEQYRSVRYKIVNVPALNADDMSNFDYDYNLGFSTEYYRQRRASFERNDDMASWLAQYMGEPIERMGSLFTVGEFRFYNGELPGGNPDRIFMAVDPAFGGGDALAAPVCVMYGDDIYVPEVIYSFEDKRMTMPMLEQAIKNYGIELVQFEANKTLESYVQEFEDMLHRDRIRCTVQSKPASTNKSKHQRIMDKASDIRDHMLFLDSNHRKTHYQKFMDNVYGFKIYDDKQHDDAPDSLAMAIAMVFRFDNNYAYTFKRRF